MKDLENGKAIETLQVQVILTIVIHFVLGTLLALALLLSN